jgi:hypothetical protein
MIQRGTHFLFSIQENAGTKAPAENYLAMKQYN